jgi:hypothetical protein
VKSQALQDEVKRLLDEVDDLEAKCVRQEALLREALVWARPDLGNRIEAALGDKP